MSIQTCSILVYSEDQRLERELLAEAQRAAAGPVGLVLFDQQPADVDWGSHGADLVYLPQNPALETFHPEPYTDAFAQVIQLVQPDLILVGGTKEGLELSARVSERLEVGCASWCVDFELDPGDKSVTAQCMIYSGVGVNTYRIKSHPALATVSTSVFEEELFADHAAETVEFAVDVDAPAMKVLEEKGKMAHGTRLEDFPVIVDVGQGFENEEDLSLARELADLLDGQVSCSRPLASEQDWFPEWIGLSGAQLSPDLCFTIGVSGAIQHMIGVRDSGTIVAVNKDENAGVHLQADYSVVADLYEFVPVLIEVLKKRRISLA
jgi:electron transfer flavoprotein alpha subunit